jgi:hypothetical protein
MVTSIDGVSVLTVDQISVNHGLKFRVIESIEPKTSQHGRKSRDGRAQYAATLLHYARALAKCLQPIAEAKLKDRTKLPSSAEEGMWRGTTAVAERHRGGVAENPLLIWILRDRSNPPSRRVAAAAPPRRRGPIFSSFATETS